MEFINKLPNWLRYLLAIPFGIVVVILGSIILYISDMFFSEAGSWWHQITSFIYKNGVNIIVFFWALHIMLPKYKLQITLTLSILFGLFYSILEGMAIILNNITLEYIIAFIEIVICLIISCYWSYKETFEETNE